MVCGYFILISVKAVVPDRNLTPLSRLHSGSAFHKNLGLNNFDIIVTLYVGYLQKYSLIV
jgi:hypothetical protein